MSHPVYEKLTNCLRLIREKTDFVPKVGIVLGSGLGGFADCMEIEETVEYSSIPGFPVSTVDGHAGRFLFGRIGRVPVVAMQGRVHCYEGYTAQDVVLPVRLMCLLGAKIMILTNAAGGINESFSPGTLMALTDHIAFFVPSPLTGGNISELGVRFPDMSEVYDKKLIGILKETASKTGVPLKEGVYLQLTGPSYETPAEIRAARVLGADAVGMSTAIEAVALRHMGARVCAVSCISNMAAGMSGRPLSHEEVKETADRVSEQFKKLIYEAVVSIGDASESDESECSEESVSDHADIYTDGACKGNPGPGGYCSIIISGGKEKKICEGFFKTTNNRMELMAAISALGALSSDKIRTVRLFSDSKYLVDGMSQGWAKKWRSNGWKKSDGSRALNNDLWDKLLSLDGEFDVEYVWVKGHAGNSYNELCDKCAVESAENPTFDDTDMSV